MTSRQIFFGVLLLAAVILGVVPTGFCQGTGYGAGPGRMYPPRTEVAVKGTVEQVRAISSGRGWGGTHLDLKTESGVLDVHLGPSSYLASKGFTFAKGDHIEVTGWKQTFQGHDAIIAREVNIDGKVLTLRNAQGIPEWSGGRRRGGLGMGRTTGPCPGCPMQ